MIKDGAPDDDVLEGLSKKLGRDWEAVARRLKFSNGEISWFDDENKRLADKAFCMLRKWKETHHLDATYQILYNALCHTFVKRKDLAEEFVPTTHPPTSTEIISAYYFRCHNLRRCSQAMHAKFAFRRM